MVAPDPASTPPAGPATPGRLAGLALAAGLLAGAASWLAGEAILVAYRDALRPKIQRGADAEEVRRFAGAVLASSSGTFASLGAILGVGLGLAGGLARRSPSGAAGAALLGGVAGAVAGASASLLVLPGFFRDHDPQSHDLMGPMLTLGSICSSVGASAGLAFGVGLGGRARWAKSLAGGLVGAALGTAAYEVLGAIAFPAGRTELPISATHASRAMLHVAVATMAAAGAALALGLSSTRRGPAPPPTSP